MFKCQLGHLCGLGLQLLYFPFISHHLYTVLCLIKGKASKLFETEKKKTVEGPAWLVCSLNMSVKNCNRKRLFSSVLLHSLQKSLRIFYMRT